MVPNSSIVEKNSIPPTKFFGSLVSSKVTISLIILPKPEIVDKVCSPSTMIVDPLPCSTVKSTTMVESNSSIVETVVTTSIQCVAYVDIKVRHLEIEPGSSNKIRLYEFQVIIACTISELITIMLSQNDMKVSHYRVMLVFCGKYLNDLNVNDKLSDHGINKYSFITMFIKCVMTNEILNSLQLNEKRDFADNSSEDVKYDKRFKGNKSNVLNDNCKDIIKSTQYLDNVPKKVNVHMRQLVDSYSSVKEQRRKLSKLILEKGVRNVTIPRIAKSIKVVSQVPLKYTIVQYRNILKKFICQ